MSSGLKHCREKGHCKGGMIKLGFCDVHEVEVPGVSLLVSCNFMRHQQEEARSDLASPKTVQYYSSDGYAEDISTYARLQLSVRDSHQAFVGVEFKTAIEGASMAPTSPIASPLIPSYTVMPHGVILVGALPRWLVNGDSVRCLNVNSAQSLYHFSHVTDN